MKYTARLKSAPAFSPSARQSRHTAANVLFHVQVKAQYSLWKLVLVEVVFRAYLQDQPELIATLDILLVVHPIEFDNVGVVREGFQDVVLRFNLLINILKKKKYKDSQSAHVYQQLLVLDKKKSQNDKQYKNKC